jgi:hypothetical protein
MKIKVFFKNPVTAILHIAGFGTSVASVYGSYQYALTEFASVPMAIMFAVGLLVAIFVGWEIALNSADNKRRLGAVIIAAVAAGFSGQTVLDNIMLVERTALQAAADAAAVTAKQDNATATAAADKAKGKADDAINTQIAALRSSNDGLTKQNDTDTATIAKLERSKQDDAKPRADALRADIAERNKTITANLADITKLTGRLIVPETKPEQTPVTAAPVVVNIKPMTVVRAYLFEVLTIVFLVFARWISAERREQEEGITAPLLAAITSAERLLVKLNEQTATATARIDELLDTVNRGERLQLADNIGAGREVADTLSGLIESAKRAIVATENRLDPIATRNEPAMNPQCDPQRTHCDPQCEPAMTADNVIGMTYTDESALLLLKSRIISPNDKGLITVEILMKETGWGKDKTKKLQELAHEQGYLSRSPFARGWAYCYPDENGVTDTQDQEAEATGTANVINLKQWRA